MSLVDSCLECGLRVHLFRCTRCKIAFYCSKDHQQKNWMKHRKSCRKIKKQQSKEEEGNKHIELKGHTVENISTGEQSVSSTSERVLTSYRENIQSNVNLDKEPSQEIMGPIRNTVSVRQETLVDPKKTAMSDFREFSLLHQEVCKDDLLEEMREALIQDMNTYGVCVIDNFLGIEKGSLVLQEVLEMRKKGVFRDGQLVSNKGRDQKTIRSDQISWISGREKSGNCDSINELVQKVDSLVMKADKKPNNGLLGQYTINSRTGAMVACYPGNGTHYVRHIDNPNHDGRCITAIYYLNIGWQESDGGVLLIDPVGQPQLGSVEPIFDRMVFFWSDRRNPHEVKPTYKMRYAITLWYFDAVEREAFILKNKKEETGAVNSR